MTPIHIGAAVATTSAAVAWTTYVDVGLRWGAAIVAIVAGLISIYKSLKRK